MWEEKWNETEIKSLALTVAISGKLGQEQSSESRHRAIGAGCYERQISENDLAMAT